MRSCALLRVCEGGGWLGGLFFPVSLALAREFLLVLLAVVSGLGTVCVAWPGCLCFDPPVTWLVQPCSALQSSPAMLGPRLEIASSSVGGLAGAEGG